MKVLIIDNYDSFTYNLYQYVGEILSATPQQTQFEISVKRNNEISLDKAKEINPDKIIISPGPGTPSDKSYFGVCQEVILEMGQTIPTMGVCLGMQGIAHCFGGTIVRAPLPMHGKTSLISHDEKGLYRNIPQGLEIMRYHSLMVDPSCLPKELSITSIIMNDQVISPEHFSKKSLQGQEIMGIRHKQFPIEGIQYHPESFATEGGKELLANFLFSE